MKLLLVALSFPAIALLVGACGTKDTPVVIPVDPSIPLPTPSEQFFVFLTSNPYAFEPEQFSFKVGTTYTLTLIGDNEFHTFSVKELWGDIFINPNETVLQNVTPDQAGVFKLVCLPHEGLGMIGEVRVS